MTTIAHQTTAAEIARRVAELAELRRTAGFAAVALADARADFEVVHGRAIREARETKTAVDAAETALRAVVADHYATTQDKKPAPGVEIKLRSTLAYDRDAAFAWARETKLALVPESLDVKAFEKIAKATPLPFVTQTDEPMVTIATDLDKALSVAAVIAPSEPETGDTSTSADARAEA